MHRLISERKKSFGTFLTKRMAAYLVAFFVVWTASSTNRLYGLITNENSFALNLLQSIFSPARGFINFAVYFYTWWYSPNRARELSTGDSQKDMQERSATQIKKSMSSASFHGSNSTVGRSVDMLSDRAKPSMPELSVIEDDEK
jgi:hypothetical protein